MTGRKVTRRASMRRKSMRSPSATRSNGSRTPRSANSEPVLSGDASFHSSYDKLDSELAGSLASLPANNSSERLSKAHEMAMSAIENKSIIALSPSEQLANDFAAVKIADSKENLAEVAKSESKASLNDLAAKNPSKGSINDLAKNNNSKGSISDLAKNRSTASLNKNSEATISKLSQSSIAIVASSEPVKGEAEGEGEAKKSTDELVNVSLNEKVEELMAPEPVAAETSSPALAVETTADAAETSSPALAAETTADAAANESTEAPAIIQAESEEEGKKSCLAQKAAKCRCIIS